MKQNKGWIRGLLAAAGLLLALTACNDTAKPTATAPPCQHVEAEDAALPPTCTATGLTAGVHCSVCGKVLTARETIPATGHKEAVLQAVAPTCTKAGLTAGESCSVCGAILRAQETIPAAEHTIVADAAIPATCTGAGLTAGSHCSVCQVILSAQKSVPATGHYAVDDAAVAATGTTSGLTAGSHCSVCGAVLTAQKATPALNDTYNLLPCQTVMGYQFIKFSVQNSKTILRIYLPQQWVMKKTDSGYDIVRDLNTVGTISVTAPPIKASAAQCLLSEKNLIEQVEVFHELYSETVNGKQTYTRVISMSYDNNLTSYTIYFCVNYAELPETALNRLLYGFSRADDTKSDIELLTLRETSAPKKVLLLSNIFLTSSKVGETLSAMLTEAGKSTDYQVETVADDSASVSTYVEDGSYTERIKSGEYAAVFLCGLYEDKDVESLKNVQAACDASSTTLALFPAYYENNYIISHFLLNNPEQTVLNWQQEITLFIDRSPRKGDYYNMNDKNYHSTRSPGMSARV